MKIQSYNTTKQMVINAPLPQETRTYKRITHEELINLTNESIYQAGFSLDKENYTMAREGQIANGTYTISNIADNEMQIQIGWQNSYNKQVTLKFAIGTHIFICSNGCVSGDYGSFRRKHTGDVQEFTPKHIIEYIKTAEDVFIEMQKSRDVMKQIELDRKITSELIGRMYLDEEFINSVQLNIIKDQMIHPIHNYNAPGSLWELYNWVTYSLKNDHPSIWMQDHIDAHRFFTNIANIEPMSFDDIIPVIEESPFKQLSWLDEINKTIIE